MFENEVDKDFQEVIDKIMKEMKEEMKANNYPCPDCGGTGVGGKVGACLFPCATCRGLGYLSKTPPTHW
jgi:DnaJ-class molecular chaperone